MSLVISVPVARSAPQQLNGSESTSDSADGSDSKVSSPAFFRFRDFKSFPSQFHTFAAKLFTALNNSNASSQSNSCSSPSSSFSLSNSSASTTAATFLDCGPDLLSLHLQVLPDGRVQVELMLIPETAVSVDSASGASSSVCPSSAMVDDGYATTRTGSRSSRARSSCTAASCSDSGCERCSITSRIGFHSSGERELEEKENKSHGHLAIDMLELEETEIKVEDGELIEIALQNPPASSSSLPPPPNSDPVPSSPSATPRNSIVAAVFAYAYLLAQFFPTSWAASSQEADHDHSKCRAVVVGEDGEEEEEEEKEGDEEAEKEDKDDIDEQKVMMDLKSNRFIPDIHRVAPQPSRSFSSIPPPPPSFPSGSGSSIPPAPPLSSRVIAIEDQKQGTGSSEFECSICQSSYSITENHITLSPCSHSYCSACLSSYVGFEVREGRVLTLSCPNLQKDSKQSCSTRFPPEQIIKLLNPDGTKEGVELVEKYNRFRLMQTNPKKYRMCPNGECGQLVKRNSRFSNDMQCESCSTGFCFDHSNAHAGQTCRQYRRANRESNRISRAVIDEDSVRCPNPFCRVRIYKHSGCNHLNCSRCGTESCYLCGGLYLGGLHFRSWAYGFGCPDMKSSGGRGGSRATWYRTLFRVIFFPVFLSVLFIFPLGCLLALESIWLGLFFGLIPIWVPLYLYVYYRAKSPAGFGMYWYNPWNDRQTKLEHVLCCGYGLFKWTLDRL